MAVKTKIKPKAIQPRIRVLRGDEIAFGPGKAELLALVGETGSIGEAARRMDMSYMRAWMLIQTMNRCFKAPLIAAVRGGQDRGGARLTETGNQVLKLYQKMDRDGFEAVQAGWGALKRLMR